MSFKPETFDDCDEDVQTMYLPLMEKVLELYPDNKIVWLHMGLSEELKYIDPVLHIGIMSRLLKTYPKLMFDISWEVLHKHYFQYPDIAKQYIAFFNAYPKRFIPGTDFVAEERKGYDEYKRLVEVNSLILKSLDTDAFRSIALGENYFRLYSLPYIAPDICAEDIDFGSKKWGEWIEKKVLGVPRK